MGKLLTNKGRWMTGTFIQESQHATISVLRASEPRVRPVAHRRGPSHPLYDSAPFLLRFLSRPRCDAPTDRQASRMNE